MLETSVHAQHEINIDDTARALRVAIISDAAPERNGVGAYYRDLADHLRGAGAQVELIAPRVRHGRWYGGLPLPMPGDPTQRVLLPSWRLLKRRLERVQPNVFIVSTPGPFGMLGMVLARRRKARLIVGFHTHFEALTDLFPHWGLGGRIANAYLTTCHRLLFRHSQMVLANSTEMLDVARRIGAPRASLMATPIPKCFLDHPPQPPRPHLTRVLFAGRLSPEKNLDSLVEAAQRLPEMEFLIAGDGPLREWLHAQSANLPNLVPLGWVRRSRIMQLIDEVDALVLPSRVESFGTIALEAMARERAVIVSGACGILSWEVLAGGLYSIGEGETLADTLARIRDLDPGQRAHTAGLARDGAIELNRRNLRHWLGVLCGEDEQHVTQFH